MYSDILSIRFFLNRLIYAARGIPDPEGAAILIESLGKVTDKASLKIDTSELRKQGAALKTRMEKIIQSLVQQQQQGQQEHAESLNTQTKLLSCTATYICYKLRNFRCNRYRYFDIGL